MHIKRTITATATALVLAGTLGAAASALKADPAPKAERQAPLRFSIADLRFEINATAGDGGVQMLLDAEGWQEARVFHKNGRELLAVQADGQLADMGLSELFFEGAEPSFDDLSYRALLRKFPAGTYVVRGTSDAGEPMIARATLTHDVPAAPRIVAPRNGGTTRVRGTVIDWRRVTHVYHGHRSIELKGYHVIVERDSGPNRVFEVDLKPSRTRVHVPAAYLQRDTDYLIEVLAVARGGGGNQTITESEFSTR